MRQDDARQDGARHAQEEMFNDRRLASFLAASLIALSLAGCSGSKTHDDRANDAAKAALLKPKKPAPPPRVTNRKANIQGVVFIPEYHRIKAGKGEMFRSPEQFRADLQTFYDMGFRPVLASEYLANKMPLAPGASPIVITFDDSMPSQLELTPDGVPTPDCAIGIWQDFAKTHPDFPVHATFFVLPDHLWTTNVVDERKAPYVRGLGSELANHTMKHPFLRKMSDARVKWELGAASEKLAELGQSLPTSLALPYGVSPKNRALLKGFDWKGKQVTFTGVFLSGAGPAKSPNSKKFNSLKIARILAVPKRFGLDFWLKELKEGRVRPYVQP
ncbi:MAG: polysaccharide deacetylase family protein [Fimbriimonas sp.]|nr:polysaccharide deacetylase family protein [Fimbriimonas sp.]